MNWDDWAETWPNAAHSRFVDSRPYRWHVQVMGEGPVLLLLHGAGAATHSWRGLAPLLARHYRLVMPDLPGHGFTRHRAGRSTLDAMAADVTTLLDTLGEVPAAYVGHSAGATIALRLALDAPAPRPVVSINGAFAAFDGFAGWLFPVMAKALALNPFTVPAFTAFASRARTERMLARTGSRIDAAGLDAYHALIGDRDHVAGTLAKMANWRLDRLSREAGRLQAPVLLMTGGRDGTVPPRVSDAFAERLHDPRHVRMPDLGHLMHEEAPDRVAAEVDAFFAAAGFEPAPARPESDPGV